MAIATAQCATSSADRQAMLHCHNLFRAHLALGKVNGQPKAADMTVMVDTANYITTNIQSSLHSSINLKFS